MGMGPGSNEDLKDLSETPNDEVIGQTEIVDEVTAYIKSIDFFGLMTIKCSSKVSDQLSESTMNSSWIEFTIKKNLESDQNLVPSFTWRFVKISDDQTEIQVQLNITNPLSISSGIGLDSLEIRFLNLTVANKYLTPPGSNSTFVTERLSKNIRK